ncbi:MAG TPA: murein biosynthesis integral membrane protein MurJ [Verrucomicrobiae bacterium]|nr:murein biosynthesis integral membrane protein MurJ [Verrucomicrobiae bacterium]
MSEMLKSSGGISAATLTSRLLGLVREQVYAAFVGTTAIYGAFIFAYQVPNLFRRLLGEGALTAAFIPIFKTKEKLEGEDAMWHSANAVISGLIVVSLEVVLIAALIITMLLLTLPWSPNSRLMLQLMRMMFPYTTLACVGAVFIGILNARGHFFIPALGAAVLNVVMIASVLFLAPHMGKHLDTQIFALAIGVLVAGVAQALFQVPTLRGEGFRYRWASPWHDPTVREVVHKMIPSTIGVAAFQINVMLTQGLAFGQSARIIGEFQYAVRLMELPQGVFGISLATFLLPTLSSFAVEKKFDHFRATLRQAVGHLVFVNLLASVLLFTLAAPIVRLLFQRGKFDAHSTEVVSFALVCLVPGLVSFSLVNILARAFYALGDILTPMRISIFCLAINLVFASVFLFVYHMGAGALGIANTLSSTFNLALLAYALRKKLRTLEMKETVAQFPLIGALALAAALIAWGLRLLWQSHIGHSNLPLRMGEVFVPMITATVFYFSTSYWLNAGSAREILQLVASKARRQSANPRP